MVKQVPLSEADKAHAAYVLEHYTPIVKAAGMWSPSLNAGNIYALAGAIQKDPGVWERSAKLSQGCVISEGTALKVLQAMTPVEIEALQMRIMTKYKNNVRER
jgi:hypothetical protein